MHRNGLAHSDQKFDTLRTLQAPFEPDLEDIFMRLNLSLNTKGTFEKRVVFRYVRVLEMRLKFSFDANFALVQALFDQMLACGAFIDFDVDFATSNFN